MKQFQVTSIPIKKELENCYDKDVYIKYCVERDVPLEYTRSCVSVNEIQCGIFPALLG
ncbi:MAG TPA: hypothetical protein PLE40_00190 [Candidatus Pacearchaeota archaeon]|nr:hypothetical protein [Candidatus Paceibacterota bacterium]HOK00816.1 hypothetical protein [Candidatus Pacearchaeota archaeon]HOL90467.1 hypothetical protein [Candidatus Pacearchaeota archaeon]HPO68161.1 hypothetical protein [Candidatus Pacearchaeota archaeon]